MIPDMWFREALCGFFGKYSSVASIGLRDGVPFSLSEGQSFSGVSDSHSEEGFVLGLDLS